HELFNPKWSERLHHEWMSNLARQRADSTVAREGRRPAPALKPTEASIPVARAAGHRPPAARGNGAPLPGYLRRGARPAPAAGRHRRPAATCAKPPGIGG